jgi:hypothetical protein
METTKTITLLCTGVIAVTISLTLTRLFLRKEKISSEKEGKIILSYGILFTSWVIGFSLLNLKTISVLNDYFDMVYEVNSSSSLIEILKTSVLFIGLTNLWLVFWYYVAKVLSVMFLGQRDNLNEIDSNNYVYFMIIGAIFISFIYVLIPIFENALRTFFPSASIPFYH